MSPRDLPIWGRAVAGVMFVGAGWFAARSPTLVDILGDSTVELSVAVVAMSFMIGMRVPPDIWPRAPLRPRFSLPIALVVPVVIAALILAASGTGLPRALLFEGRAAVPLVLVGASAWALAWGRTPHEVYGRWFGVATAAAVGPVAVGALVSAVQGQLPPLPPSAFVPVGTLFVMVAATGSLVTQELAFRRLLVGQAGDAGLAIVLGAAVVFGLWHFVIPTTGSAVQASIGGLANGVALGSLYVLSRSLLVCAWYHGVQLGALNVLRHQAAVAVGGTGLGDGFWLAQLLATGATAGALGYFVWRRNGVRGPMMRDHAPLEPVDPPEEVSDAAGD